LNLSLRYTESTLAKKETTHAELNSKTVAKRGDLDEISSRIPTAHPRRKEKAPSHRPPATKAMNPDDQVQPLL
jgi:hypothetical protein